MSPRRMGRPGLLGMAARTAVVAGTATAVSGNVQRRQQAKAQDAQQQADAEAQQAQYDQQAQQNQYEAAQQAAAPPASAGSPLLDQLNQLSQLHNAGVLSDEEFTAAKTKLLA
ncbi:SHOCT domain-containing protein [Cryobacterium sp. SO2]|uniref:SHOCT domain-containing protein n=1 Tax=Cryobacterium sp. SO2 TaxID=1897060 RepID=UPI00223E3FB6|nr:SHOCT domain-containing protein [Cryobacterium sp. SO2]WEO75732.1 SHOCT domain-containing protein [Cryobacterium sp. SO2]